MTRRSSDGRRNVVVDGGEGQVGAAHFAASEAKAFESLWRGDLVHEVQVDVEQRGLALGGTHDVCVPDFIEECLRVDIGPQGLKPEFLGGGLKSCPDACSIF